MKLRRRTGILLLVLLLLLSGCRKAPAAAAQTGVEVTDCAGRTVTVPEQVDRVACLYA